MTLILLDLLISGDPGSKPEFGCRPVESIMQYQQLPMQQVFPISLMLLKRIKRQEPIQGDIGIVSGIVRK